MAVCSRSANFDQDASFGEPDTTRRNNRGNYRGRPYHGNRSYGERDGEGGQEDYRANRRQYDRQPRSFVT